MHKRDISMWLKTLSMQTVDLEIILVVYNDYVPQGMQSDNGIEDYPVNLKIINVEGPDGPYPEAWLKNIGIRAASGDVVCCTNVDILYTEDFFKCIEDACKPGVLVQATRFNTPEGTTVSLDKENIRIDMPEGSSMDITIDPEVDVPAMARAVGDCQAMVEEDWEDLTGYNEAFVGWGGLDTDLECRVLLAGKSVYNIGFAAPQRDGVRVSHYHAWHPRDFDKMQDEGWKNKEHLDVTLKEGNTSPNKEWGEYGRVQMQGV
jgi:hypothetical protein